jgi:hypothetical protein
LWLLAFDNKANAQRRDAINYTVEVCEINPDVRYFQQAIKQSCNIKIENENKVISQEGSRYPLFVKINIKDSIKEPLALQISNPTIDNITLYTPNGLGFDSIRIDETQPVELRNYPDQNYVFTLLPKHSNSTVYLRVKSGEQLLIPIEITTFENIKIKNTKRDNAVYFYLGIMLVMFLYNLFIYVNTKEKSYLIYVLFILFVALTQITLHGFFNRYLPAQFSWLKVYSLYIFGAASGIFTLLFFITFIETRKYIGKVNYILIAFVGIDILAISVLPFKWFQLSYTLININAGLGSIIVLIIAAFISTKGNRSARFFLIAWSLFLASVIVFVLKDYGVVPYNDFTRYILLYGSALEVTLLSFALADKINSLKKDKDIAQAEALMVAQENAKITREQNVLLEQKVKERTKELISSNESLTVALADLKQAQTQLVESEKMASLGQLTAGIAHEINNPINFVTSNVKPLQRDIHELYHLQEKTEALAKDGKLNLDEIEQLKKEIDYDYLKTEINYLLKGIHEGSSRTAEIVKGLRIFSRVDEDDIKLADVNEGLESTIIIINNQLNNKIEVQRNYGNIPLVECYPGKLNQVFLNLISNAIYAVKQRFNEEEGGLVKITTQESTDSIIIEIGDNGTGMSETTKNKLFEPFFTTKPVGEGTGLGLSIVYNTIKKHHGNITVKTAIGEGTTFTITIPKKR